MKFYDTNEYRATKDWPYAITAGCVVYRKVDSEFQILLLERSAENERTEQSVVTYHLPKGHNRFDETIMQTAVRETFEESGCEVEIQTYLGALQKTYVFRGQNFNRVFHFFAAEMRSETETMDEEHDGKLWVLLAEAKRLLGPPNPKGEDEILERFEKFLELTDAA